MKKEKPLKIPNRVNAAIISNIPIMSNQKPEAILPSKDIIPFTKAKKNKNLKNGTLGKSKITIPMIMSNAAKNLLGISRVKESTRYNFYVAMLNNSLQNFSPNI